MSNDLVSQNLPLARSEFTKHLHQLLSPLIYEGFKSIYEDSKELCEKNKRKYETLKHFQLFLKAIPKWNATILEQETVRIKGKCPLIMQVVTAIFMSYVKILSSVRLKGSSSKIKIKIPTCDVFIHSVYTKSAEQIFGSPFLMKENVPSYTRHENREKVIYIINESIDKTITDMVPIESILQEYIGDINEDEDVDAEEEQSEEDEESVDGKSLYIEESDDNEQSEDEEESDDDEQNKIISIGDNSQPVKNPYNNEKLEFGNNHEEDEEENDESDDEIIHENEPNVPEHRRDSDPREHRRDQEPREHRRDSEHREKNERRDENKLF